MFEDSTFASTGRIRMRSRAGFAAAFLLDTAIVLSLVLAPLIYPRILPHKFIDFLVNVPGYLPAPDFKTVLRFVAEGHMERGEKFEDFQKTVTR